MDTLIREAINDFNSPTTVTYLDLIFSIVFSFILSTVLARVYILTHSGHSYSRSYTISLILVSVTVALIMIIIGSNIARAFALVGAMSIVRFRNPLKDSRDLAFIFTAIAIGMACGTQFYAFAIIFTLFVCVVVFGLQLTGFGIIRSRNYVLRIRLPRIHRNAIEQVCQEYCVSYYVVTLDRLAGDSDIEEIVYELELQKKKSYESLIQDLGEVSNSVSVSLLVGESVVDV